MLCGGAIAVAASAALVASCLRLRSAVAFLLAAYLLASTEVVVVVLFLFPGRWLTRGGLLVCVGAIAVISAALWVYWTTATSVDP